MGFFLQLRLLLWKNFTLKRRKPIVLMLELVIPLVLFIILVGIRIKQPAQAFASQYFPVWPLPSAGLISVMQAFCDKGETDQYGFFNNSNSTVTDFLLQLNSVAENNNFFEPKFTLDELDQIPRIYRSIVEDPISVKKAFDSDDFEMRPSSLFEDMNKAEDVLVQRLAFERPNVLYILNNTSIDKKNFYSLVFKFSTEQRVIHHGVNKRAVQSDLSPYQDMLPPDTRYSVLEPFIGGIFLKFMGGKSPKKEKILQSIGGKPKLSIEESLELMKNVLSDSEVAEEMWCEEGIQSVVSIVQCDGVASIEEEKYCRDHLEKFRQHFCSLNDAEKEYLLDFVFGEVNKTLMAKGFREEWNYNNIYGKIQVLAKDMNTFITFKKTVRTMAKLTESLPSGYCHSGKRSKNSEDLDNLEQTEDLAGADNIMHNQAAPHDKPNIDGAKPRKIVPNKPNLPYALLKIWKAMQKTVCGKVFEFKEEEVQSLKDMGLSKYQMEKLELLIHVLYNNPKVLYSPTGTQADLVIQKANQTFVLFDKINEYAHKILVVGGEIQEFLSKPETANNLVQLKEIQDDIIRSPLYSLFVSKPAIQEFLSDPDITSKENFIKEISTIMLAACSWNELMKGLTFNIFKGFRTEDEMLAYFKNRAYFDNITVLAGVVFHMNNDGSLPNHMIYKIRQNASLTINTKRVRNRFWFPGPRVWGYNYYYFGFVWVQDILERAMISLYAERDVTGPGSYLQQFPYPCYIRDQFLFMIQHVMPLCLTISWVYSVAILVQHVVYEKEQRLKEVMKMMGLKNGVLWIAWFVTSFSQMTVTIAILTLVLKYGKVLTYSNPWIVFLTLECFSVAIIMFSFLVSAMYSKAKLAAACAGIIYFMSYVPYMYIAVKEESANEIVPAWLKAAASLLAPTAFGLGAKYFAFYEEIGVGVQWSNIWASPAESDSYNLAAVLIMLVVDAIFYGVVFWYIENIHPGAFGLPRPWYFPLQKSYWLGYDLTEDSPGSPKIPNVKNRSKLARVLRSVFTTSPRLTQAGIEQEQPSTENVNSFNQLYELDQENLILGVSVGNLSKRYKGSRKYALKDLTLNLFEGQITALLGHNGAGKTTTISILTGLFPPTSGYALIYGRNIRLHMDLIRRSLGMCPQHNVLFDDLTLEEHMWFYSRLKSDTTTDFDAETNKLIADLKIPNKRHHKVSTLSGGMKRKLSVAIAFVGGSKTVILDEPTAGVDPYARRAIWDLIIKYKKGRTILLSTHHMDEADILGDKIAILESGRLKCFGSPLYLKNHLGEGYHLFIVKELIDEEASITSKCSEPEVTSAIQKIIRTARLVGESKHELHYVLPLQELRRGNFVPLFQFLNQSKEKLFISGFGVKNTTLEEIFIKVIAERRNSDTSLDKIIPPVPSLSHSLNHSRQASGTLTSVHGRQLGRDAKLYVHSSTEIPTQRFKKTHSRNNSTDAQLPRLKLGHTRHASDVNEASVPLLPSHRRQHSHDIFFDRNHSSKGTVLNPDFENELLIRLKNAKILNKLDGVVDDANANAGIAVAGSAKASGTPEVKRKIDSVLEQSSSQIDGLHVTKGSLNLNRRSRSKEVNTGDGDKVPEKGTIKDPVCLDMHETEFIIGKRKLLLHQFRALIWKRYLFARKNIEGMFSQILLPAFFVSVAMSVALTSPAIEDLTEMILSPSQFYNASRDRVNFIAFANNKLDLSETNTYENADSSKIAATLRLASGVGASCVLRDPFQLRNQNVSTVTPWEAEFDAGDFVGLCSDVFNSGGENKEFFVDLPPGSVSFTAPASRERKYPICTCNDDNTGFTCPSYGYTDPGTIQLFSGDTLVDISGQNESQYYLYTTDVFRLRRYGGLGFGLINALVPSEFGKSSPNAFRKVAVRHATKIWFNNQGYHSIPIFVNVMNNAILRANIPPEKGTPAAYGMTVINHPFPNSQTMFSQDEILQGNDVLIAIFIIVAMSFVPASFVLFLVYERSSKSKHLQIISGVHRVVYWVSNYTWDIMNYTVPAAFCILILLIFDVPAYTSRQNFPAVVSLFLMYGWSVTPVMYPASFIFKDPSSAYISLIVANLFVGITCVVTSFLLEVFSYDEMLGKVHVVLKSMFLVFPNYCLGRGLMELAFNDYYNQFLLNTGQYHKVKSPFAWDIISRNLVAMAATGITFFIITLLCEYNFFRKPRSYNKFLRAHALEDEDADVFVEKKRVARGSAQEDVLTVRDLTKVYCSRKTGKHLVVDQLSWGVPPGECFGLLGVNGAGKSSTFKMLTGDIRITKGDATISGFSVKTDLYSAYRFIGYCPQFDALYDELSAREHLTLYATLRGIQEKFRADLVEWALAKLDLSQYADRPVGTYSGGNKRKVSTAIALIGGPSLIFLDEPTTGMDPYSKRFLWDLMLSLVKEGKSIVFTSHSMEECEALCTRLAIMVNGRFKCLGSTQHLKNKFGDGYTIKIKCQEVETEDVENYMRMSFRFAVLKEKHYNCLHYELHSRYAFLDDIFYKMENAMEQLYIQDYSVSQNTLDNVFINFVKDQNEQHENQLASLADQESSSSEHDVDENLDRLFSAEPMEMSCEVSI